MLAARVVIGEPLGARQPRIEALGVEVAIVDLVARCAVSRSTISRCSAALKLVSTGMGVEDEDVHARVRQLALCRPLNRNVLPER